MTATMEVRSSVPTTQSGIPSERETRELMPHLCYEIKMLLTTDLLLLREQVKPRDPTALEDWTIHNALFEAHTIHARSLYSFFFLGRGKPEDAVAGDYVADWTRKRPKSVTVLKTLSPRVGKEVAHLTYGRLAYKNDEERQWAFTDITKALIDVINLWLEAAPQYAREMLLPYIADYAAQGEIAARPIQPPP
jgi:hypothetical protein